MPKLRNFVEKFAGWGESLGVIVVIFLLGVSCSDVLGSKLFNMPVKGATEIISMLQLVVISCVLGMTQKRREHVSVEMFVMKLPLKFQHIAGGFTAFMIVLLHGILIWEMLLLGESYYSSKEVTATVLIPFFPFAFVLAAAMISGFIMSFCDFVDLIKEL